MADKKIGTVFADNIASTFKELLKLKLSGACFEQQSLRTLLNAVDVSVLEGRRRARKELRGETKKLFERKKWPIRPGLQISQHVKFIRSILKHVRQQPQKLNCLKTYPRRNFGEWLDDDLKMASKVFWHTVRRLRGKRFQTAFFFEDSNGVFLNDQDAILNKWRKYLSDLLNQVDATPTQIYEEHIEENIQTTKTDLHAVIKSLKTGRAPGEDDIEPEMLKAINVCGVRWLTRVFQVACRSGQAPTQ